MWQVILGTPPGAVPSLRLENCIMAKNLDSAPVTTTTGIKGREGRFMLVRKGPRNSRVARLDPPRGEGWKVPTGLLMDCVEVHGVYRTVKDNATAWFPQEEFSDLPFGVTSLRPKVTFREEMALCVVQGCDQWVTPPSKGNPGTVCPRHGIRTHRSGTWSFARRDAQHNVTCARDVFTALLASGNKFESRCHLENSEDSVSFSTFMSLKQAGMLSLFVQWVTGISVPEREVHLILWGTDVDDMQPFYALTVARDHFERDIPQGMPKSEPDVMLFVPGRLLLLVEVKFGSGNGILLPGQKKKNELSRSHEELLNRYQDLTCQSLDYAKAAQGAVAQQLWRYGLFAEFMGRECDVPWALANLTRKGREVQSQDLFRSLLKPEAVERFSCVSWEGLYELTNFKRRETAKLRTYLENKSLGLKQAFNLGRTWQYPAA